VYTYKLQKKSFTFVARPRVKQCRAWYW